MARGQLPKAYLRIDPNLDQHPEYDGMVLLICAAARQSRRGYFTRAVVDRILGRKRAERFLAPRGAGKVPDLVTEEDGALHLAGWEEWNEGDLTVGERMRRIRGRRAGYSCNTAVSDDVTEPFPNRDPPSEASRQQGSKAGTEGATSSPRRLKKASQAEYDRLLAEPDVRALGELWQREHGGDLGLGLLRACAALFRGGYSAQTGQQASGALVLARQHPDLFDARAQARWCLGHNKAPEYVLRAGIVERLADEYRAAIAKLAPASSPATAPVPRQLAERDDVPATDEDMAKIRGMKSAAGA